MPLIIKIMSMPTLKTNHYQFILTCIHPWSCALYIVHLYFISLQVHADATLVFPLLVAETFAVNYIVPPPLPNDESTCSSSQHLDIHN